METSEAIRSRRSNRRFSSNKIDPMIIEQILELAIEAPYAVALGREPWKFLVLQGEKKEEFIDITEKAARRLSNQVKEEREGLSIY